MIFNNTNERNIKTNYFSSSSHVIYSSLFSLCYFSQSCHFWY